MGVRVESEYAEKGRLVRRRPFCWMELRRAVLLCAGRFGVLGIELGHLNFFGETNLGEEPDAVVVDAQLIPGETMSCADGVGVVIVMPALAAGEQGDPPGIAGIILCFEAAAAKHVRS